MKPFLELILIIEGIVRKAIRRMIKGRTGTTFAHRLSAALESDGVVIIKMDK